MAIRTTVVLTSEDERALREATQKEGLSQSELIRRGVRVVTAPYRRWRVPSVGWLSLTDRERRELAEERFGDPDA